MKKEHTGRYNKMIIIDPFLCETFRTDYLIDCGLPNTIFFRFCEGYVMDELFL
jgi:hypothetical protein